MTDIQFTDGGQLDNQPMLAFTASSHIEPNVIQFYSGELEVLKFCPNGDIFVQGRLAENDQEVVDNIRTWAETMLYKN